MNFRDFKNDIQNFIAQYKNSDIKTIKKEYYRLVKKYHPDTVFDNKETNNKYMVILNRIYSDIKNKKNVHKAIRHNFPCKENKYQFVNRYNCIEKTTDKALFFYKIGLDSIFWSIDYLCEYPASKNYGKEIIIKVLNELNKAILYLNAVIKMEDANWIDEVIIWANEIKDRITKHLI